MENILIFEGAGWDKCDSATDIGNCRIRPRIQNNKNEIIYLEMMGREKQSGKREMDWPKFVGFVSHCFMGEESNNVSKYRKFEVGERIVWNARSVLAWVNKNLDCSFSSLSVENDGVRVHDTKLPLCVSNNG